MGTDGNKSGPHGEDIRVRIPLALSWDAEEPSAGRIDISIGNVCA